MADNDLDPLWQDLDWYVTYTPINFIRPSCRVPIYSEWATRTAAGPALGPSACCWLTSRRQGDRPDADYGMGWHRGHAPDPKPH